MTNDIMRPIIAQEKSAFNIREIMDQKKIFLVNLSKGRLGDINANLIGLILVGKFLQAALSRVDATERPDFYLYIDEFQNITTPSIATILSEARKYRLSLNIAHQYIAQLPEDIKGAVFGNVGSMALFRVGPDDAQYLESQLSPTFTASDLMKIENYHAYMKMLVRGEPKKPFDIVALAPEHGDRSRVDPLRELSYLTYGRPRDEVENEILRKYQL
jgi:type IV secretory pathway TraG/TraD family ATPase VirD4